MVVNLRRHHNSAGGRERSWACSFCCSSGWESVAGIGGRTEAQQRSLPPSPARRVQAPSRKTHLHLQLNRQPHPKRPLAAQRTKNSESFETGESKRRLRKAARSSLRSKTRKGNTRTITAFL